jgi:hypothetical protein
VTVGAQIRWLNAAIAGVATIPAVLITLVLAIPLGEHIPLGWLPADWIEHRSIVTAVVVVVALVGSGTILHRFRLFELLWYRIRWWLAVGLAFSLHAAGSSWRSLTTRWGPAWSLVGVLTVLPSALVAFYIHRGLPETEEWLAEAVNFVNEASLDAKSAQRARHLVDRAALLSVPPEAVFPAIDRFSSALNALYASGGQARLQASTRDAALAEVRAANASPGSAADALLRAFAAKLLLTEHSNSANSTKAFEAIDELQHFRTEDVELTQLRIGDTPSRINTAVREALLNLIAGAEMYAGTEYARYQHWSSMHGSAEPRDSLLAKAAKRYECLFRSAASTPFGRARAANNRADLLLRRLRIERPQTHGGIAEDDSPAMAAWKALGEQVRAYRDDLIDQLPSGTRAQHLITLAQMSAVLAHDAAERYQRQYPGVDDLNADVLLEVATLLSDGIAYAGSGVRAGYPVAHFESTEAPELRRILKYGKASRDAGATFSSPALHAEYSRAQRSLALIVNDASKRP